MKKYFLVGLLICQGFNSCRTKFEEAKLDRPNIIIIIADDMNWDDCGAYGHPTIKTTHIDNLAKAGMRFDHAIGLCRKEQRLLLSN